MKCITVLLSLMTFALASCCKDEPVADTTEMLQQEWHYVLFSGAEAPVCEFAKGVKVYTFGNSELVVDDNYFSDDWCGGTFKGGGTYDYEVKMIDDVEFLFIEEIEIGRITFVEGDLLIESWIRSDGAIIDDAPTFKLVL